ncbi:hypothetical protein OIO90_005132 [Microbotryomycetes sp. JL221]|nr:hypothetical protein OIO90_005132 [Microbotryomycetes sp. JL221]
MVRTKTVTRSLDEGLSSKAVKAIESKGSAVPEDGVQLGGFKAVASYNWIEETPASILVPGSPPIWANPELPMAPEKDKDAKASVVDANAAHQPEAPLAPLVAAIKTLEPNYDFKSINIVTDRINLRRLINWASPDHAADLKDFRIDLDRVGDTMLMTRWEPTNEGGKAAIEQAFRKEALSDPTCYPEDKEVGSHHRIVELEFLGKKMLVRFPVDACLAEARQRSLSTSTAGTLSPQNNSADLPPMQDIASGLTIHTAGGLVPQSSLVELSLMSKTAKFDRLSAMEQMFFSQTPSLYLSRHSKGTFGSYEDVKLREMRVEEKKAQPALMTLGAVLDDVSKALKDMGNNAKASLICKGGKLEMFERTEGIQGLPEGLASAFD